jgi:rod shape-determining protein MreC
VAALITLVVLVTLMSVTSRERETVMLLQRALIEVFAPVQAWFGSLASGVRSGVDDIQTIGRLREENLTLRAKADAYDAIRSRMEEIEFENERLRALLGFTRSVELEYVAANVVARNPDNWFSRLTINRGSADGIAKDMPVVTPQGVVGRIIEVSSNVSVVQLLTDRSSGAGGIVQSSRDAGIVNGQGSQSPFLVMMLFARDAVVNEGDTIVTSGFGEIYPPGLYIGRVVEVRREQYGLIRQATIRPGVEFNRLHEVLVITNARAGAASGGAGP